MEAANTQANRSLAQAVNSRIMADAVMLNAKSTVWRLIGIGVMCSLIGLGVEAAFFGYSYIHDPRTSAQKMAQAFAEALEKTTLTGEVKLDPQAAVKLNTNGAQVQVDPTSTVRLDLPRGAAPGPVSTESQYGTGLTPGQGRDKLHPSSRP